MKHNYTSQILKQIQLLFIFLIAKQEKYVLTFILGASSLSVSSQSILEHEIPSPDVGSLLRVKAPSVDLYTGRPNISIPLYSIKLKNFSYDIQMAYNAEGNKVDFPVGSIGLGWSITGGQIHRIINGAFPEEVYTISEYLGRTEVSDWDQESNLCKYYEPNIDNEMHHYPDLDEFVINIGKINASFYVYKDKTGAIKSEISSKSSPYFEIKDIKIGEIPKSLFMKAKWENPYTGKVRYPELYIEPRPFSIIEITVVDSNGIIYIFGGDFDAIDLSCQYRQDPYYSDYFDKFGNQTMDHNLAWDDFQSSLSGTASTWHIKKIVLPNQENIIFNYTRGNLSVIERFDHHVISTINHSGKSFYSNTIPQYTEIPDGVNAQYLFLIDKKYDMVYPSLLKSISASNGDEVKFVLSKRNDLPTYGYYDNQKYFFKDNYGFFVSRIKEQSYSYKIDEIQGKTDCIKFYYTDTLNQRLKLDSILINKEKKYKFQYNPLLLPPYNQMLIDNWGYYNNKNYFRFISGLKFDGLYNYRQPDSLCVKAQILEKIIYPTGGEVSFQYESHTYSKIATQYPFGIKQESGIAGGVRIKQIKVSSKKESSTDIIKDYFYLNEDNTSSGILSVVPKYTTTGIGRIDYESKSLKVHGTYSYGYSTSTQINWVDKFHMNYSRIIEALSDGSKIIYSYTNHSQIKDEPSVASFSLGINNELYNKYTSKELDRGLLESVQYYNNTNELLRKEAFTYHSDLSCYLKTINRYALTGGMPIRVSANKIYTYYPFLEKKATTHYTGKQSVVETEEYEYNKYRLLTRTKKSVEGSNHDDNYIMNTKYLSDLMDEYNSISSAPITNDSPLKTYDIMRSKGMLALPVETTTIRAGDVISANVITYKNSLGNIVCDKIYKLEPNTPLKNYSSFKLLNSNQFMIDEKCSVDVEYMNYDTHGNPVSVVNQKGDSIVSIWGYNGQYPVAVFKNAMNSTFIESKCILTPSQAPELRTNYYNDVFYENFEESSKATSSGFNSEKSFVGSYNIPTNFKLNPAKKYVIDYQVFRNGKWNYAKHELENRNCTINENNYPIDDIRIYPQDAIATSYNYIPIFGLLRSKTDCRGVTESYEYDTSGRLRVVKDHNADVIKKADYRISGITTDYTTKYYCGVTFDNTMPGGDGSITTRLLEVGSTLPTPATLYEYSFEGWFDGATRVTVVPQSSEIILKAKLTKIQDVNIHLRSYIRPNGTEFIMLEADEEVLDTCPIKLYKYSVSFIDWETTTSTIVIELREGSYSNEEECGVIPNENREVDYALKEAPTWNGKKSKYYNSEGIEDICILRFKDEHEDPIHY